MNPSKFADLRSLGQTAFAARGEYFEGSVPELRLLEILQIDDDLVKPFTRQLLTWRNGTIELALEELGKGIWAYLQFQDVVDMEITSEISEFRNRHYCYYESVCHLREAAVSLLDGNTLACGILLRPFLELSVFHLYWYLRCKHKSYAPFYDWLKAPERSRSFQNAINSVLKSIPARSVVPSRRISILRSVLLSYHQSLSSQHHLVLPDDAIAGISGFNGISYQHLLGTLLTMNVLINQIVVLYSLTYPVTVFPVTIYNRFGLSRPVGLLFDTINCKIIESFLGEKTILWLRERLGTLPEVQSLLQWVEAQPYTSDAQLIQAFQDKQKMTEQPSIGQVIASEKAELRALNWFFNYWSKPVSEVVDDLETDEATKMLERIKSWP